MPDTAISVRLPAELLAALREYVSEKSVTMSDALRDGVLMLLGYCPTCGHKAPGQAREHAEGQTEDHR